MDARVKQSSRYGTITAFSGCEFVKYEWRVVPAGKEAEAAKHPHLEVKQVGMDVLSSLPSFQEQPPENAEPQPALKPDKAESKNSRRRK